MIAWHGDENRRRDEVMSTMLCRLLDRTPLERSEASWSFYSMSERSNRSLNARSLPLPSGMGIDDESDQVT
jgi:hypothetical protein